MIDDKELSVVVPKAKFHQMENKIKELQGLTNELLNPGDNIIIVRVDNERRGVMDKHYNWETLSYTKFKVEGGGQIIQSMLDTQRWDYDALLRHCDYSLPRTENQILEENKTLEKVIENLKNKLSITESFNNKKSKKNY